LSVKGLSSFDGGVIFMSALFSAVFRRLFPSRVRALKQPGNETSGVLQERGPIFVMATHPDAPKPAYFKVTDKQGAWCVNFFADSYGREANNSGPFHFVKDGVIIGGADSRCVVEAVRDKPLITTTLSELLQRAETTVQRETKDAQ
jgi:hypothetical protein